MKLIITGILASLLIIGACIFRTDTKVCEAPEDYGKYNTVVNDYLEEYYSGTLPDVEKESISKYSYKYRGSQFEFLDFIIDTTVKYDAASFNSEKERLLSIPYCESFTEEDRLYLSYNCDIGKIQQYTDSELLDGLNFHFEFVILDSSDYTIRYITSKSDEGYGRIDTLCEMCRLFEDNIQ